MTKQTTVDAKALEPKALEAARVKFLEIFGDPSAVPADYGLEVAATITAYLTALSEQPAPDHVGLVEKLRQRARCRENYFLPENETLEWQAAEAIAALTASAKSEASRAPEGVVVKPLEWREEPIPPAWECLASTGVGLYCIPLGRNVFVLRFRDKDTLGEFDALAAAKSAAQADYDKRILSAVATPPATPS